jgi:regulator of RNase E activity RraB
LWRARKLIKRIANNAIGGRWTGWATLFESVRVVDGSDGDADDNHDGNADGSK